jgi:hypothetical protein
MAAQALNPIVVHAARLPEEILVRAGLGMEPLVMLERTEPGGRVRKLTVAEKIEYADRTGANVFFGSDQEFDNAVRYVGSVLRSGSAGA